MAALAILVGGTGLYLRAVGPRPRHGALPSDPASAPGSRRSSPRDGLGRRRPAPGRSRRGAPRGPTSRNPRRVVRALEIAELAGDAPPPPPRGYPARSPGSGCPSTPAPHRDWIANRARAQFDAGLVEEARALRERYDPALPAFSAIGYREAWALLDGKMTARPRSSADAQRNVAFAKRQRTWFRSEPDIEWLDAEDDPASVAAALVRARELVTEPDPR